MNVRKVQDKRMKGPRELRVEAEDILGQVLVGYMANLYTDEGFQALMDKLPKDKQVAMKERLLRKVLDHEEG